MAATLPEILLECRDGRSRPGCGARTPTRARGGLNVSCGGCGKALRVPASRPHSEAPARSEAARDDTREAAPDPPSWRDALGDDCNDPDARCPADCPCGGAGTIRYTSCRTGTVCEECGPADCWAPSPTAEAKAAERVQAERTAAIRTGHATARMSQQELDQRSRMAHRMRKNRLAWIDQRLRWPLDPDVRTDLEWFREQVTDTSDLDRLLGLGKELLDLGLDDPPAPPSRTRVLIGRLLSREEYDDLADDDDPADDDYPEPEQAEPRRAIEAAPVPGYVTPVADPTLSFWANWDTLQHQSAVRDNVRAARARANQVANANRSMAHEN